MARLPAAVALGALAAVTTRIFFRNWGATKLEARTTLPGDELVSEPAEVITRAVTVEAPAARVWPELVRRVETTDGFAPRIVRIEEGHSIVLRMEPWDLVWSFHVLPHGPNRCRIVARSRAPQASGLHWMVEQLADPMTFVMTRRLLLAIKRQAETAETPGPPARSAAQ